MALDAEGLVAAGGRYMVDDVQLKKLREAIAADASGKQLVAIVADLLRHKRLIYWKRWAVEPWIATPKARDRVAKAWRDGEALNAWCARYMDPRR